MVTVRQYITRIMTDDRRVLVLYQERNDRIPAVSVYISEVQYKALLLVGVQDLETEIGKIPGERITGNAAVQPETVAGG